MKKNTFIFKMIFLFILLSTILFTNIPNLFSKASANVVFRPVVIYISENENFNRKNLAGILLAAQWNNYLSKDLLEVIEVNKKIWGVEHLTDDNCPASFSTLLEWVLEYYYSRGYQIKFITSTLIILEQT